MLAGEDSSAFQSAKHNFIEPILTTTKLTKDSFFIVPGNHDISRKAVRANSYVEAGASATLTSDEALNQFIDKLNGNDVASTSVIERSANFYHFVRSEFDHAPIISDPLLRVFLFERKDLRAGIACFDSSWRATGESDGADRNKLLVGERNIDRAISAIESFDLKIALFHHPLEWLAEFDEITVSSRLYNGFDLLACGHIHSSSSISKFKSSHAAWSSL